MGFFFFKLKKLKNMYFFLNWRIIALWVFSEGFIHTQGRVGTDTHNLHI